MVYSQGWVNNLNDCNIGPHYQTPYIAGVLHDRPACLWLWDQFGCDPSHPLSITHPDYVPDDFSHISWLLLWPDDKAPEARPPEACRYPLARHFRDRGVVSVRSGWSADDLHVTMIAGEPVRTAHRQGDQTQVTLYALGERFLIDTGYRETDPQSGGQISGSAAEAHNLVLIDGEGQSSFVSADGWPMGHIESFAAGEDHAYAMGDAGEAYSSKLVVRRAERHLHAVWREGLSPYVIWADDVEADGMPHRYTLMLHTALGNRFEWGDDRIVIHGQRSLLDIHLITSSPSAIHDERYGRHPRLHVEQTDERARFVMLLHPRRPEDAEAVFRCELGSDSIRAEVQLCGQKATHIFDTSERVEVLSGLPVCTVRGPIWGE